MKTIREIVFQGFTPCSNGYCLIGGKAMGMHTNGGCRCLVSMNKSELSIIEGRLIAIADIEIDLATKEKTA